MSGFHGAFATGVASQQGTLTLPDTWFRPQFWDLLMLQLLRPNSSNLPCLYSTFHLEYPLVLSRFYLEQVILHNIDLDLNLLKNKQCSIAFISIESVWSTTIVSSYKLWLLSVLENSMESKNRTSVCWFNVTLIRFVSQRFCFVIEDL